jgi:hypothetical protein
MTDAALTVRHDARRRATRLAALALGLVVLAASAYHAAALTAYRDSARPGATVDRLESARLAASLEPWDRRFAWRVIALRGQLLFEQGRLDDAYRLLEPYSQAVRGDETYRQAYQEVVRVKTPIDSGKAHVAHGLDPAAPWPPGKAP